jgi:hypothetical protein
MLKLAIGFCSLKQNELFGVFASFADACVLPTRLLKNDLSFAPNAELATHHQNS